jgi:hypothetical protein
MGKALFYLGLGVWIIVYASKRKQWSWPSFAWVMLTAVIVGGAGIWRGIALTDLRIMIRRPSPAV